MHHPIRRIVLATLVVGAFAALAGSGCAVGSPRRGGPGVVYAESGYDGGYYQQQPAVVVAQPTYVQPTYVQPTYYVAPSYGYYQQPARVVVAPARGYYGRGYYAPGYDRRGYYGGRQRAVVYAPGPAPRQRGYYAPRRGPAVYVR